ncbi:cytochrome b/b6 domain-containing protein [Sphingomonas rosea]|uniref:Cytochrome b/b6 domain-containing protein n=1 Tax=Sphingomonas rosea TaxID=335605 RepID=A0ABP7U990_9SPHN
MSTVLDPPSAEPAAEPAPVADADHPIGGDLVKRHRLSTRLWHWTNAVTLLVMLMSGLMIFNAHPRLYWGSYGANPDRAWLEVTSTTTKGYLRVGPVQLETTGVMGYWKAPDGSIQRRAFPHWATIPSSYSLADARIWHLAFAWLLSLGLLAYSIVSLVNRHFQKDLRIRAAEMAPRNIWHDIKEHARLRFPTGEAALRYNILQKLAYASVLFFLLPLVILTGMTMSPALVSGLSPLLDLFGGRQSARSLHFLAAFGLVAFFLVHIAMVVLAGPYNEVRSMITGRFRLPRERAEP